MALSALRREAAPGAELSVGRTSDPGTVPAAWAPGLSKHMSPYICSLLGRAGLGHLPPETVFKPRQRSRLTAARSDRPATAPP